MGATKSRAEWCLLQTMSALFRPGRDSAGVDQTAQFNSRFLALSARSVCFSLLSTSSPCQSGKQPRPARWFLAGWDPVLMDRQLIGSDQKM